MYIRIFISPSVTLPKEIFVRMFHKNIKARSTTDHEPMRREYGTDFIMILRKINAIKSPHFLNRNICFQKIKPLTVVCSESHNVFENIALENVFYEKCDFNENKRILFLWRNKDCVVIGRHQNPWKEVNLRLLNHLNFHLCRRMSGGGSVFHDLGNLNFTFLTSKTNYNRTENLDFIISVLKDTYNFDVKRNAKDDILLNNEFKISGTAAKIGLHNAYHHCTLLCSTDLDNLSSLLRHPFGDNIKTNATQSVLSRTRNLFHDQEVDFQCLLNLFASKFFRRYGNTECEIFKIHPKNIPGIHKEVERISSWNWIYGKSPKFTLLKPIILPDLTKCDVVMTINKGVFQNFSFNSSSSNVDMNLIKIFKLLTGVRVEYEAMLTAVLPYNKDKDLLFYCNQMLSWFDISSTTYLS